MKTAILAFLVAISGAFAQGPVTPPSQPASGPGGNDYPHASYAKSGPFGRGGDAYYLYEPAEPTLATAPVVVFLHGYNGVDPSTQEGWIGHLARKSHIVIFPVYQDGPNRAQSYTPNAKTAIKQALKKLKRSNTKPDTGKFALIGYSLGATIAANIAGSARQSGLPSATALFVAHAGDTTVLNPRSRPILASPSRIPDLFLLGVVGNDDDFVGDAYTKNIVEGATKVPGSRKNLIRVFSDDTGAPALSSDHLAPVAGSSTSNALDFFGYWKWSEALLDLAFRGENAEFAIGDTEAQRDMGDWSDGTPVHEAEVTTY
jgi:acetyl esterase/lipase